MATGDPRQATAAVKPKRGQLGGHAPLVTVVSEQIITAHIGVDRTVVMNTREARELSASLKKILAPVKAS